MTITILVTDRNLIPVGDPIAVWSDLEVVGRFNEPSSGSFKMPATAANLTLLAGGNRVLVLRDNEEFVAGPFERPFGPYTWDAEKGGPGEVTVHFADDSALIAGRVTYPEAEAVATDQTAVEAWTAVGINGEEVMRLLVDLNAGPGALLERRIPKLVLGPLASVGGLVTITSRFEPLGDALRRVALAAGGLGYRTRQAGQNIEFQVFGPLDLSGTVRFSRGLGNLRSLTYEVEAPTVTAAIVAGQGEGTARTIREVTDPAAIAEWWRLEKFIDQRQTNETAELDAAGAEAVTDGGQRIKISTVTVDTDDQKYGIHYGLGDQVAVEYVPGLQRTDVVRGVQFQASAETGELVTALIGSQEASGDPAWLKVGRDLARRLGILERR